MVCRSAKASDERRRVAVDTLKKQIEKYSNNPEHKAKKEQAEKTLAATFANMGKGLTALKSK